jgi:hypothetical protein
VKRVQNPVLWKRYALTREEIATETGGLYVRAAVVEL